MRVPRSRSPELCGDLRQQLVQPVDSRTVITSEHDHYAPLPRPRSARATLTEVEQHPRRTGPHRARLIVERINTLDLIQRVNHALPGISERHAITSPASVCAGPPAAALPRPDRVDGPARLPRHPATRPTAAPA